MKTGGSPDCPTDYSLLIPVLNYPQATHDWRETLGETHT